jgi:hypothetical protein
MAIKLHTDGIEGPDEFQREPRIGVNRQTR